MRMIESPHRRFAEGDLPEHRSCWAQLRGHYQSNQVCSDSHKIRFALSKKNTKPTKPKPTKPKAKSSSKSAPKGKAGKKGGKKDGPFLKVISDNRKARHRYQILESIECGLILRGSEVKSLRNGKCQLDEAYGRVIGETLWLVGCG